MTPSSPSRISKIVQRIKAGRPNEGNRLLRKQLADPHARAQLIVDLHDLAGTGDYRSVLAICEALNASVYVSSESLLLQAFAANALKQHTLALECIKRHRRTFPTVWQSEYSAGLALAGLHKFEEAIACLDACLRINPDCVDAHINLGNIHHSMGDLDGALAAYSDALRIQPFNSTALHNRAVVLNLLGRHAQALDDLNALPPMTLATTSVALQRVVSLAHLGRLNEAEDICTFLHDRSPSDVATLLARAQIDIALQRYSNAIEIIAKIRSVTVHAREVDNALVTALRGLCRYADALSVHDARIEQEPDSPINYVDRATTRAEYGDAQGAKSDLHHAISLAPDWPVPRFDLSLIQLSEGDLAAGWKGYTYRWCRIGTRPTGFDDLVMWNGEPLGTNDRILVRAEQGVGEEIFFASQFELLQHAVIECSGKLLPIFRRSFPTLNFFERFSRPPETISQKLRYQVSLGDIPRRYIDSHISPSNNAAYLKPNRERVAYWRARIGTPHLKVGFSWRSSNRMGDRALSFTSIISWKPVLAVPGVRWICLQYDECEDELEYAQKSLGINLTRFDNINYKDDLDEVSALTSALDLVITAPTAVSFLSAAMGVETWHLSLGPEWQSLGRRDHFPWLPKLVRCSRPPLTTWPEYMTLIAERLHHRAQQASVDV